jgi:hypothetical protein
MKILRWIAVIPASFVAYAVANLVQTLFAGEWMPADALEYLQSHPDLGPFPIQGIALCRHHRTGVYRRGHVRSAAGGPTK